MVHLYMCYNVTICHLIPTYYILVLVLHSNAMKNLARQADEVLQSPSTECVCNNAPRVFDRK